MLHAEAPAGGDARAAAEAVARAVAASSAERAACEARFAAACAASAAAGAPAPFRGPAADSALGERFLDALPVVCAHAHGVELRGARFVCGLTLREGVRRADGSLDRAGFLGGTADMIAGATRIQAPWLAAARAAPRRDSLMPGPFGDFTVGRTTSLMRAAAHSDERGVRQLLAAGAPLLGCVDSIGRGALHYAAWRGDARAVAALLAADAEGSTVNAQNRFGSSPLILASWNGHEDAAGALLARGALLETRGVHGMTALHWAARNGHAGVAALLCRAARSGLAAAMKDDGGNTPLLLAVANGGGGEGLVAALLAADAAGATVDARDGAGNTVSERGVGVGGAYACACARARAQLACATARNSRARLRATRVRDCARANACDSHAARCAHSHDVRHRSQPLMWASRNGCERAVHLLLARGARQELRGQYKRTALHTAAANAHAGVVAQLCAAEGAGAVVAMCNFSGDTPLSLVSAREQDGRAHVRARACGGTSRVLERAPFARGRGPHSLPLASPRADHPGRRRP